MVEPVILKGKRLILRNIDWSTDLAPLCRWNSNPEVLKFIEEDEISPRTRDKTKKLYEYFDQNDQLLIAELEGEGAAGKPG